MTALKFTAPQDALPEIGLLRFCETLQEREKVQACIDIGNITHAARHLKTDERNFRRSIARIKARAAAQGHAPEFGMTEQVPDGFKLKGRSVLRKLDPVTGQRVEVLSWDKTSADEERRAEMWRAALDEACRNDIPALAPVPGPTHSVADLLNFYVFTDYHLGMRAWAEEGGADWNLEIAEDLIIRSFQYMLDNTPDSEVGFIAQLGDFAHFDSLRPVTPTSGHIVDASSHYTEIVRAIIRIMRRMVAMALAKHPKVVVLMAEGNHDIASSVWMREIAKSWYADEPRVEVVDSAHPFYAYEWGVTMLAIHHGHAAKKTDFAKLFANFFAEMWGRTKKRYGHAGHYHHEVVVAEDGGMTTKQHSTLAPNDSHSARHAYKSERQTDATIYSRRTGKVSELICTPEMLYLPERLAA